MKPAKLMKPQHNLKLNAAMLDQCCNEVALQNISIAIKKDQVGKVIKEFNIGYTNCKKFSKLLITFYSHC